MLRIASTDPSEPEIRTLMRITGLPRILAMFVVITVWNTTQATDPSDGWFTPDEVKAWTKWPYDAQALWDALLKAGVIEEACPGKGIAKAGILKATNN